jgi:hypothetical protein
LTAEWIASYLRKHVPTFDILRLLDTGVAYHYTTRADEILEAKKLLGAPLSIDLDNAETANGPKRASADPGVVFAYTSLQEAVEEGNAKSLVYDLPAHIFRIQYSCAVEALHLQEDVLEPEPSILIPSNCITSFECLGTCDELWGTE